MEREDIGERMIKKMDDNKFSVIDIHDIKSMIYEVRGRQVMLDSDLAIVFNCTGGTRTK